MSNKVLPYHITALVATISTSLDARKVTIACFSDLKKAFETVMYFIVINKILYIEKMILSKKKHNGIVEVCTMNALSNPASPMGSNLYFLRPKYCINF